MSYAFGRSCSSVSGVSTSAATSAQTAIAASSHARGPVGKAEARERYLYGRAPTCEFRRGAHASARVTALAGRRRSVERAVYAVVSPSTASNASPSAR